MHLTYFHTFIHSYIDAPAVWIWSSSLAHAHSHSMSPNLGD